MICLLQLRGVSNVSWIRVAFGSPLAVWSDVQSAGEEAALLGHLVAEFTVCGNGPGEPDDADKNEAHNSGVALPVARLRVPTTGGRPDVLGVPGCGQRAGGRGIGGRRLRDLSSSAHCEVQVWRYLGVGVAAGWRAVGGAGEGCRCRCR